MLTISKDRLGHANNSKLVEDLQKYDGIFIRAKDGDVFSPDHEACKLFRGMAEKARRKAESIAYRSACRGNVAFD